jgi:hypothetical protein
VDHAVGVGGALADGVQVVEVTAQHGDPLRLQLCRGGVGQDTFEGLFLQHIAAPPPDAEPFAVITRTLRAVAADFFPPERQAYARQRQTIIDGHPGLQERELLKLSGLTAAMATALRERGTPEPTATLVAECGVTIFRVAFARWVGGSAGPDLVPIIDGVLDELRSLTARPA